MRSVARNLLNRIERQLWARRSYKFVRHRWAGLEDLTRLADVLATMRAGREIAPLELDFPADKRIAVLAPHPDDEIIGPGGTLIGAIQRGCKVSVIYLTSGNGRAEVAEQREQEAREVATSVGFDTVFLKFERLDDDISEAAAETLRGCLADLSPDMIFVPFLADDHAEHRRASEILARIFDHDAGLGNPEVWAYQVYGAVIANVIVDIASTAKAKADAIGLFRSQMETRDWSHYALGLNAYNSRFLTSAQATYGEMFFVLPLSEYAAFCRQYFAATP